MDFKVFYSRIEYISFLRNYLLPEDFEEHEEKITVGFQPQIIQNVNKIGEVPSLELNIYEIEHQSENDPRVSLSRETFRLLAQYSIKRALIIFTSKKSANFRLSLVTIDLKWQEGKRVQKEYSNPRRYSFFLGPDSKIHTPEEYLSKKGRVKDFDDLKNRFSIEVVNKEFYTAIAFLFTKLAGGKREIGRKSFDAGTGCLKLPSTSDDTRRKEFTVRLIGRLVFCWFLKKKKSDKDIPLLPEDLLSSDAIQKNKNYYHNILEPLFFEVLNTPGVNRIKTYEDAPWNAIPFLNGGLFNPHLNDFYNPGTLGISKHINTLKIPDEWIKELFDIFETYNFTIDENTSIDVELSIEPEMLGRIFENLLAEINPQTGETARKSTGSYYTPRPIVEYMVDESIKQYILTKTKLSEDKVSSLLSYEDVEPNLTDNEKNAVIDALDTIKIIDPACGSGAFPMGILQKILLILQKIDTESKKWLDKKLAKTGDTLLKKDLIAKLKADNFNYIHKLGIIRDAIYGVDIQPIAVEISKLRFFLSLIVDEKVDDSKENRGIEPLPNLEFKFVCANSLIGLPKKYSQPGLYEEDKDINILKDLRDEYLRSFGDEKKKIEKKFQEVQSKMFKNTLVWRGQDSQTLKLSQWKPFSEEQCSWFDSEWMFGICTLSPFEKGGQWGFDIVIGNPPYIKEDINKQAFDGLKNLDCYQGKMDIWYLFGSKGLDLLREQGILCFIATNNWISNDGASKFRNKIINQGRIVNFIDFGEHKIFTAGIQTMVFIISKNKEPQEYFLKYGRLINSCADNKILEEFLSESDETLRNEFAKFEVKFLRANFCDKYINFIHPINGKILSKIEAIGHFFINRDEIFSGIDVMQDFVSKQHLEILGSKFSVGDGIFVLQDSEKEKIKWNKNELGIIKPYYTTKEINKYCARKNNKYWIIYAGAEINKKINDYPNIKKHLCKFQKVITSVNKPYGLHRTRDSKIFVGEKILSIRKCSDPEFSFVDFPCYVSRTFLIIKSERLSLKYLLAILNSKLIRFWLFYRGKLQGNMHQVDKVPLLGVPIVIASDSIRDEIVNIVDKIIAISVANEQNVLAKDNKIGDYIGQIDKMVYELYGLTTEEIKIVEKQ